MKLTYTELAFVRSQGLSLTEKCDGCGKLLNQTVKYTIAGRIGGGTGTDEHTRSSVERAVA